MRSAWTFWNGAAAGVEAGVEAGGWSSTEADAVAVFEFKHMTGQDHAFYSPALKRCGILRRPDLVCAAAAVKLYLSNKG